MSASMFDNVSIRENSLTKALGLAGLIGQVYGETTPPVTGVEVIGASSNDIALNVHFRVQEKALWFAPDLVEFVDHAPGTTVGITGKKQWTRTQTGEWEENSESGIS